MKETENKEFIDFLKVAFGQKEVVLIMAKNIDELSDFSRIMNDEGFKRSDNILDILNSPKMYLSVDENMNKDVYDFVVQYPTGQVEIFDNTAMKSSTLVFLVLKEDLGKIQEKGWNILSLCGPTYQSQI